MVTLGQQELQLQNAKAKITEIVINRLKISMCKKNTMRYL